MGRLETNDWIVINSIVYEIYSIEDTLEMQRRFLERMKSLIDYDAAEFCLSDGESDRLIESVAMGFKNGSSEEFDFMDYSKDIRYGGRSLICRGSDMMPEDRRIKTPYYEKVYRANGLHYSLQMILGYEGKFLGIVTLYKKKKHGDFDYYDIFSLDIMKEHMSFSLYKRMNSAVKGESFDVDGIVDRYGLTRRETEVLRHIIKRQDNQSISKELVISINTLKKHERNIYQKCHVGSRMQLFKLLSNGEDN